MEDSNSNIKLITQIRINPEKINEFLQWKEKLSNLIHKFPGFLSQSVISPNEKNKSNLTITQNFVSLKATKDWLQSNEYQKLLSDLVPVLIGIDSIFISDENNKDQKNVSVLIAITIKPPDELEFLNWQARIASIQSKAPGFIGYKLEKIESKAFNKWNALIKFDSDENLQKWLDSKERKKMVEELKKFTVEIHFQKIYSGFDFWFNPKKRSAIKENMLVLLTLYPVVFLLSFIQSPLVKKGVPFCITLFVSNAASTIILGWLTMPLLLKLFSWWLYPKKELVKKNNFIGSLIVLFLYVMFLIIFCLMSKYI